MSADELADQAARRDEAIVRLARALAAWMLEAYLRGVPVDEGLLRWALLRLRGVERALVPGRAAELTREALRGAGVLPP